MQADRIVTKFIFLLTFLFVLNVVNGQIRDSTQPYVPETWKKYHIGIRAGAGIQRSFYFEAGLSLQKYVYEARHGFMVSTFYAVFERTAGTSGETPVYGVKGGAELINNGAGGAIEIKYLANSEKEDVMITPKYGFGLGFINIMYGYNFSTNKYPFPNIGKHQFSLVINTNILFHDPEKKK